MKFKLSTIALALPFATIAMAQAQDVTVGDRAHYGSSQVKAELQSKQAKAAFGEQYFVLLEDAPVSLYQGDIKGLAATNVQASNYKNINQGGKLNLKSAASVAYTQYVHDRQQTAFVNIEKLLQRKVAEQARHHIALNALVLNIDKQEAQAIQKLDGVIGVQKVGWKQLLTDVGPSHVGAPAVWNNETLAGKSMGEGLVIGVLDTGIASYQKRFYSWSGTPTADDFNPAFADIGGDGYDHTNPYGDGVYFGDCLENTMWCNDKLVGVVSLTA